jgi:signal transduction histidine kinase/CheY-like chemotaxis protein
LYFANQAIKLADENDLIDKRIQATNYLGVAYRNLSLYSKALEMYLVALELAESTDNFEQRGYALINIANLYLFQKDYLGARNYLIRALDQAQELVDRNMMAYCYVNLGRVHRELQEYDLAEQYFDQAMDMRRLLGDDYGLISVELDKAEILRLKGAFDESLQLFESIMPRLIEINDLRGIARTHNSLARIHLSRGNFKKGETSATDAIRIARGLSLKYEEKEALKTLSDLYGAKGDYKSAFEHQVRYSNLNYLLFSEEKIRQIEQLKSQAEIEKQEAEKEILRQQKERQQTISYLLAAIAFLFSVAAFVSYRAFILKKQLSEEIRKQKEEIEKDKEVIERQSDKLRELDAAKSRFFANISHDLRTPLSLILGNLELIMEDRHSDLSPATKKNVEISYKNTKRLIYLTDEINDITRLEEGKIRLRKENVQIVPFLKVLSDMFRSTAEYKGVKLEFESSVKSSEVAQIDARQFEKVYYNLVSNAIRHTQEGSKIMISVARDGDRISIRFADTGEGIHESVLPYIFDRFYQSQFNEYRTKEGLGIGLALVKELIELHGGDITVTSQLGKGTVFTVTLPASDAEGGVLVGVSEYIQSHQEVNKGLEMQSSASVDVTDKDRAKSRILIVDDHPEIRYYIRQILEEAYDVQEAAHGLEALDILATQTIDLIVTDLMMPWMDGFELIEAIQDNPEFSKIPMLIVSARISDTDREKALIQGINNFMQKPFDRRELMLRISNLIEQRTDHEPFADVATRQNLEGVGKEILKKVEEFIKENIEDTNLGVLQLGDAIAASERQVYRLIKKVTGKTPYEYITEVRLQYADYLIRKNMVRSASEVARSVGIKNVTTFSRLYHKRFGKRPSDLLDK